MKPILTLFALSFILISTVSAQQLSFGKNFWTGHSFYLNGDRLSNVETESFLRDHPEAFKEYKEYIKHKNASGLLGFVGGFILGWQVGNVVSGERPHPVGAVFGLASTIASFSATKKYIEAADDVVSSYYSNYNRQKINKSR